MRNDELKHYGVLGMKWGVRKYQNKDGTLNAKGRRKYYDKNGRLNEEGQKLKFDASGMRTDGKYNNANILTGMALRGMMTHGIYNAGRNYIHSKGNQMMVKQTIANVSFGKRKATAAAFIAGMGAVTMAEIYPYAKLATRKIMYDYDADYRKRVNAMADLKTRLK